MERIRTGQLQQARTFTKEIDREILLLRVFNARRDDVFHAWTDKERLHSWYGPRGFMCSTHEINVKKGGVWRFDLIKGDGHRINNRVVFLDVQSPSCLVFLHSSDREDDPTAVQVTVTFEEHQSRKTVVTLRQLHPTKVQREALLYSGAVELGYQTLDKLALHLQQS
jgi:uncharacterized protein YndB with AHSA1/START domain